MIWPNALPDTGSWDSNRIHASCWIFTAFTASNVGAIRKAFVNFRLLLFLLSVSATFVCELNLLADEASTATVAEDAAKPIRKEQEDDAVELKQEVDVQTSSPAPSKAFANLIPDQLPDGRRLRKVGFLQTQDIELVPDGFVPVSVSELSRRIAALQKASATGQDAEIKSAAYWIEIDDGLLTSRCSSVEFSAEQQFPISVSLGRPNFSLLSMGSPAGVSGDAESESRTSIAFQNRADGNLFAVLAPRSSSSVDKPVDANKITTFDFAWQLRGNPTSDGHEYDVQLPQSLRSRLIISVDQDLVVNASNGVVKQLSEPPAESKEWTELNGRAWYQVQVGAGSRLTLNTKQTNPLASASPFLIQQSRIEYSIDRTGVTFLQRIRAQIPAGGSIPPLVVRNGSVSSVKVNSTETRLTTEVLSDDSPVAGSSTNQFATAGERILATIPPGLLSDRDSAISLTITGQGSFSDQVDLPIVRLEGSAVVNTSVVDEAQLAIERPLRLLEWKLPDAWSIQPSVTVDDYTVFSATGPANPVSDVVSSVGRNVAGWSQALVQRESAYGPGQTLTRLSVEGAFLVARTRIELTVRKSSLPPIAINLEKGWSVERARFLGSNRSIALAQGGNDASPVVIWPTYGDLQETPQSLDAQTDIDQVAAAENASSSPPPGVVVDTDLSSQKVLVLEFIGRKSINRRPVVTQIPATWFVKVDGIHNRVLIGIGIPSELKWSTNATLLPEQLALQELTPEQRSFLRFDRRTLAFEPALGRTPNLYLEPSEVSYDAELVHVLTSDKELVNEAIVLRIDSSGQDLQELSVATGRSDDGPEFVWTLVDDEAQRSSTFTASDVSIVDSESDQIYVLNVAGVNLSGRSILGKRSYAATKMQLPLPDVPGAATVRSELIIGRGLYVDLLDRSAQRIPMLPLEDSIFGLSLNPQQVEDLRYGSRIRYDSTAKQVISLDVARTASPKNLVTKMQTHVIASSRGSDQIETSLTGVFPDKIVIQHDHELRLIGVIRNGRAVQPEMLLSNEISIAPAMSKNASANQKIVVRWNRDQLASRLGRRVRIPNVTVNAEIMHAGCSLAASEDSFLPKLLTHKTHASQSSRLVVDPGSRHTVIRSDILIACGWLVSLFIFVLCRILGRNRLMYVPMLVVVTTAVAILWWQWRLPVIGWVVLPAVLACLFDRSRKDNNPTSTDSRSNDISRGNSSQEFSWTAMTRILLIANTFAVVGLNSGRLDAQDSTKLGEFSSFNILVPVDPAIGINNELVYIPATLDEYLFSIEDNIQPILPKLQSIKYEVTLTKGTRGDLSANVDALVLFSGDYSPNQNNRALLDFKADQVSRIELVGDRYQLVRFSSDDSGKTLLDLPPGLSFSLRVRFQPVSVLPGDWSKVELKVPALNRSSVSIESDFDVEAVRLSGSRGQLLEETDLRRWEALLEPKESLEVEFRIPPSSVDSGTEIERPLQRRYWVSVGLTETAIRCEIDPPDSTALGELFQFVVRDSEAPLIASADWKLVELAPVSTYRQLVTVQSIRDKPSPVGLLWKRTLDYRQEAVGERSAGALAGWEQGTLDIPEVVAASLGDNAPAWVAFDKDDAFQMMPLDREIAEPLSVDQFLAGWTGYRSQIDRAYVTLNTIPDVVFKKAQQPMLDLQTVHRVNIDPTSLVVDFRTVIRSQPDIAAYVVSLPESLSINQISLGGVPINPSRWNRAGRIELLIDVSTNSRPEDLELRLVGQRAFEKGGQIRPPIFWVRPRMDSGVSEAFGHRVRNTVRYAMHRSKDARVSFLRPFGEAAERLSPKVDAESLSGGLIPVATWLFSVLPRTNEVPRSSANSLASTARQDGGKPTRVEKPFDTGRIEVRRAANRFGTTQLTSIRRVGGRWRADTTIQFSSPSVPDYVDLEVPTRWCDSLVVTGAKTWIQQAGIDQSNQIVRVRCENDVNQGDTITVSGLFSQADSGRVSVPMIRVLGLGERRAFVSVPNQLVSENLRWRTSGVSRSKLPGRLASMLSDQGVSHSDTSILRVNRKNWFVDMAPLPDVNRNPVALSQDTAIYCGSAGTFVSTHWIVQPGSSNTLTIRVPKTAKLISAWSAGKQVESSTIDRQSLDRSEQLIELPFTLTRLPQEVQLLIRLPSSAPLSRDRLPSLRDADIEAPWITVHYPSGFSDSQADLPGELNSQRCFELAKAIVSTIQSSVDLLVERGNEEVALWVQPLLERYQRLSLAGGHTTTIAKEESIKPGSGEITEGGPVPDQEWAKLDEALVPFVTQYLGSDPVTPSLNESLQTLDGFELSEVIRVSDDTQLSNVFFHKSSDNSLRYWLGNCLTLLLVIGVMISLRQFNYLLEPWVSSPAVWLIVLAMIAFAVAPPYIAVSLLLTGAVLLALPSRHSFHQAKS